MMSFDLHVSPSNPTELVCAGVTPDGTAWKVSGGYSVDEDGLTRYDVTMTYASRYHTQHFSGRLDPEGSTLSGLWGHNPHHKQEPFFLRRIPCDILCLRPSPFEFGQKKPRALWRFALGAVMEQVKKQRFNWSLILERRRQGRRYVELLARRDLDELTPQEVEELSAYHKRLTPSEARFYCMSYDLKERMALKHP